MTQINDKRWLNKVVKQSDETKLEKMVSHMKKGLKQSDATKWCNKLKAQCDATNWWYEVIIYV